MSKIAIPWGVAMLMVASASACWAQDAAKYPAKPIRMVIALAPGGGVDTSGRLLGQNSSMRGVSRSWPTIGPARAAPLPPRSLRARRPMVIRCS